jgi:hypothetical protein
VLKEEKAQNIRYIASVEQPKRKVMEEIKAIEELALCN